MEIPGAVSYPLAKVGLLRLVFYDCIMVFNVDIIVTNDDYLGLICLFSAATKVNPDIQIYMLVCMCV